MQLRSGMPWGRLMLALGFATLPICAIAVTAAPPGRSAVEPDVRADAPEITSPNIRLNYVDAKWSKVLQNFANAAGLELVAEKLPNRKYTRWDSAKYSIKDAQKILAVELEKLGYRMKVDGDQLIVSSKQDSQTHYPRPVLNPNNKWLQTADSLHATTSPRKKSFASESIRPEREPVAEPVPQRRAAVQQAAAEAPDQAPKARPIPKPVVPKRPAARPAEMVTTVARLEHQTALKVARNIYEGFRPRAELVDEGPRGLPAFHVLQADAEGSVSSITPRLTISIDEDQNELVIQAAAEDAHAASRLVALLDVPPNPRETVRMVATTKDAQRVAQAIQPRLDELAQLPKRMRLAQAEQEQPRQPVEPPVEGQPPVQGQGRQIQIPPAPGRPGVQLDVGDLRGPVEIEALPGSDMLVIKGAKEDVEKVMAIIRQIEQLSIGTAPDVEIIYVQHVSADGLAALLTDVYSRLTAVRRGGVGGAQQQAQTVAVIPLARPNAILVLAPQGDMADLKELARKLDRPTDPENEYKVFRLKSAIASQVMQRITDLYPAAAAAAAPGQAQATTTAGLAPRVRVTADIRMNALIVQARPRDLEEIAALIKDLDQPGPESLNQIRIFPLRNAVADELATTLSEAIQSAINPPRQAGTGQQGAFQGLGATGQGPQELRDVRSSVLQFINAEGGDSREFRSGILSDIRITADARTNSVVVTAPEASMELMAELVHQFDRPSTAVAEIKVFSLTNGDATQMVDLLEALFAQQQQGQGQNQQGQLGIQLAGAEDASSTLIPLRFSVDTRTNSIIAIGGAEALRVVEAILLRLDTSDIRQRETKVYRLRNSPATEVATAINEFLTSRRDVQTAEPGLISPFEQLEREVIVVAEAVSNSLVISATPRYFNEIQDIILKLDAAPQQVVIQALLVEVALDNTDEWGVDFGLQDSLLFGRSVLDAPLTISQTVTAPNGVQTTSQQILSQTATPGFAFNNQALGNNIANRENFAGQALSNLAVGRLNADLGYGGLVLSGGNESISVLLRALAARRRVDVLSRPQVRVADNQLAQIQVGSQFPRANGVTVNQTTGAASPTVEQIDVGIILQVIPRITPEKDVVMELVATKSGIQPGSGVTIFTNPDGGIITSPIVDITTARTTVSVRTGQTIVMGGMITKTESHTERKVPILGDIPILGIPFRYDLHQMRRSELLIFLTPRVIDNDYESEMLKQIEMDRLHFVECEAEEMHGPLRAFPDALTCPPETGDVYQDLHMQPPPNGATGPYSPPPPDSPSGPDYLPPTSAVPQTTLPPGPPITPLEDVPTGPDLNDPPQGARATPRGRAVQLTSHDQAPAARQSKKPQPTPQGNPRQLTNLEEVPIGQVISDPRHAAREESREQQPKKQVKVSVQDVPEE